MNILPDDLSGPAIAAFLQQHIDDMRSISPPESKHALDLEGLRQPQITFWSVYEGSTLAGCGALRELDPAHGEIKSMRTAPACRGRGIASALLEHILNEAASRGYQRVSLETGAMPFFAPAHRLYRRHGFVPCPPFADYCEDPNSLFFTRSLV